MKRILSILLTALMVLTIIPVSVFMASAEGEVKTLYNNEFDTAMNPNGGTPSSCSREDYASFGDGKGMTVYGNGSWTEPVTLDNNSGEIVVTMYFYNNNFMNGTTLSINGVALFGGNSGGVPTIGGVAQGTSAKNWRLGTLTVTISDLSTGVANVKYVDQYGNTFNGNVTVGAINDKIDLKLGSFPNSFKVDYVKVTQVHVEDQPEEPDQPDQPDQPGDDVIPTDLFSTGEKSYAGWTDASVDTYTVTANGTSGDITVVMVTGNTNWQGKAKILTINGKTVFYGNGRSGQPAYSLGDDAAVYDTWNGRTITVVINPTTGDATVSDGVGNSATTNVGVIGNTFNVVVGQPNTNSWKLTSLTVTQAIGAVEDTQSRDTYNYYYNDFTTEKSNSGLISNYTGKGSTVVDGALCVNPAEVNQWSNANAVFPSGVVFKFDFMLPVLPTGDEVVKLLFDRTSYDYFIHVTESGVKMNGGNPVNTVAIEANKYYTVTIVMADTGSVVYVDGTLVGTCARTLSGRPNNYGLFNFNANAGDNTLTYYIDNIAVTDVADETFVKVVGYQKTNVDNGTYCVRFTTAVFDLYAGEECIGFDIEAPAFGKSWNKTTTTVYTSLTANYGTEEVLASDEGAKYITAMALTGLPASEGTIELVVTPYVVINGIKVCGTAVTVTVNPVQ